MATTPIDLKTVGKVPVRDNPLSSRTAPSVVEVFPGVFLIASIVRAKNQCVLELVQPPRVPDSTDTKSSAPELSTTTASLSSSSFPPGVVQRRLLESNSVVREQRTAVPPPPATARAASVHLPAASIPVAIKSGFRVPRIIQLVAEDEGVIETVTLVREPLVSAVAAALEEQDRASAQNPLRDSSLASSLSFASKNVSVGGSGFAAGAVPASSSLNYVHVHFFIGTSNGTVLVGNALRGTILAVAQFQYHHFFDSESRGSRPTTTSTSTPNDHLDVGSSTTQRRADGAPLPPSGATNQAVVKFMVRERRDEQLWNPSLPFSYEANRYSNPHTAGTGALASRGKNSANNSYSSTATSSPTAASRVVAVYVVHSGGKVVELNRDALNVFVQTSVDRLDGRRPHLILEWEPETSPSAFPVAGPACDFSAHVNGVFTLELPPAFSIIEKGTATTKAASAESTSSAIYDADLFTELPTRAAPFSSALLAPLDTQRRSSVTLLVGGTSPLFSFFHLRPPASGFSASNAVKAVKSMVAGVAKSLWFSALGTSNSVERPPHLKKVPAPCAHPFLQADAKCTSLQVDPTQQWAALAIEGGGRVYVVDVQTGVVQVVLKGCRAAQFTWWWTEAAAGRPALLFVVYLPLRRALEVYTARTWERLAACHVPAGSVLLKTCGVPSEPRRTLDMKPSSSNISGTNGNGSGRTALLMDPAGNVYGVCIGWVLEDPFRSLSRHRLSCVPPAVTDAAAAELVSQSSGTESLPSPSVLRGCQSPDDFLELTLQLALPVPHVEMEDAGLAATATNSAPSSSAGASVVYSVKGGDAVRVYAKRVKLLCEALQRRFAPGYAEIVVTPLPCRSEEVLEGSLAGVPHNTTAAQCLHYIQLYLSVVENFYRLLSCRPVPASRYFDPQQWTSGLVTSVLWSVNFSTQVAGGNANASSSAAVTNFVKQVEDRFTAVLAAYPTESSLYKKFFAGSLRQVMQKTLPRSQAKTSFSPLSSSIMLADPSDMMPLPAFLRCFYCGTGRPLFLRCAIARTEDADGSVNFLGAFSDVVFGIRGIDGFFSQLPALGDLGCTDADVALLTLTWIARQGGRSLTALLSSTTIGLFAAALLTFCDTDFLSAVDRAAIPFISIQGDIATQTAVDSMTALLWCCAVRNAVRPIATMDLRERFERRVRQLLQLWYSLANGTASAVAASSSFSMTPPPATTERSASPGSDARVAFSLRLGSVEPSATISPTFPLNGPPNAAVPFCSTRAAADAEDGRALASPPVDGDAMEVYLQRNGISISLLDGFAVPRPDADPEAVHHLPLFSAFASSLAATENARGRSASDAPDVVESLPWIEDREWDAERFRGEVVRPLEKFWQELSNTPSSLPPTRPTAAATAASPTTTMTAARRGGTLGRGGRSSVYLSCLLLVAMSVLEHALRPLTDVAFFFWDNNAVPDGNFFPVAGAPRGLILSGSRTTREYLKSLQKLTSLVERMVSKLAAFPELSDRALLIQNISLALAEDDKLLFPLMPNFLRARLTVWMQVLAQAPHAPLRRVQRVGRLADLLLFFSEASALTMGGVALTQLQSQLTIPWKDLIGGPDRREQLRLLPDVFIPDGRISELLASTDPQAATAPGTTSVAVSLSMYAREDEDPIKAPLNVAVAALVLRRFLAAGGVLYSNQQSQPLTSTHVPAPCLGLVASDTRQCLTRLAHCLGLDVVYPDMAEIVSMDYEIKHLFPVASVEQEMLLLPTKAAAPLVAAASLRCYLVLVLQYVTSQRNSFGRRGERAAFDSTSDKLRSLVQVLTEDSRQWIQERETEMMRDVAAQARQDEGETRVGSPSTLLSFSFRGRSGSGGEGNSTNSSTAGTSTSSAATVLCDSTWVALVEHQEMGRRVFAILALPNGTPQRRNFFQLLFTLAQWVCEGRLNLPTSIQRVARELPVIVEKWEKLV